ncbi:MAG TPA: DUF2269 family protein [Actinomycetota bacterium]|nr:DUF2269 family protein [Actinomycetota bacterium]
MAYQWWVFLHIAGVFAFLIAHGVSVGVAFRLRRERDPRRIMALLDLSSWSISLMYIGILLLLTGGIVAGFVGDWWGSGWIWVSLGTLIVVIVAMYAVASAYYKRLRLIVGAMADGSQAVSEEQLAGLLEGPRPWILAVIGFGGLLFILYLMLFKPF